MPILIGIVVLAAILLAKRSDAAPRKDPTPELPPNPTHGEAEGHGQPGLEETIGGAVAGLIPVLGGLMTGVPAGGATTIAGTAGTTAITTGTTAGSGSGAGAGSGSGAGAAVAATTTAVVMTTAEIAATVVFVVIVIIIIATAIGSEIVRGNALILSGYRLMYNAFMLYRKVQEEFFGTYEIALYNRRVDTDKRVIDVLAEAHPDLQFNALESGTPDTYSVPYEATTQNGVRWTSTKWLPHLLQVTEK